MLSHSFGFTAKIRPKKSINRGVAQLVERVLWEHQAVGSNPATPTKNPLRSLISEDFSLFTVVQILTVSMLTVLL